MEQKRYGTEMKYPRKLKKKILGIRASKSKLKRMIKEINVIHTSEIYSPSKIEPFEFCPYCGCTEVNHGTNRTMYPEIWQIDTCSRCGQQVAEIDNSVRVHILEELYVLHQIEKKRKWHSNK